MGAESPRVDVSVVLPFRNSERWLLETLESVRKDIAAFGGRAELILVDSDSTDRSLEVAQRFLASHTMAATLLHAPKAGATIARNLGASRAAGEWLSFVDADDLAVTGRLETLHRFARAAAANVAVVHSPFVHLDLVGSEWKEGRIRTPLLSPRDAALSLLDAENFLQLGSIFIRAAAWRAVGGMDESMPIVHDVNLYVRLAIAGYAFESCPGTPTLLFRQHASGSLTTSSAPNFYRDAERNADLVRNHYRALGRMNEIDVEAALRDAYFFIAYGYARTDVPALARVCEKLDSLSCSPIPDGARPLLRLAGRALGYKRALAWSGKWSRLKTAVRS